MTSLVEKDCQWRNYNITTLREEQFVNPYGNPLSKIKLLSHIYHFVFVSKMTLNKLKIDHMGELAI